MEMARAEFPAVFLKMIVWPMVASLFLLLVCPMITSASPDVYNNDDFVELSNDTSSEFFPFYYREFREGIKKVCWKCRGNTYLDSYCNEQHGTVCLPCHHTRYQIDDWHLSTTCLDNETAVRQFLHSRKCPDDDQFFNNVTRQCEACSKCDKHEISKPCRDDGFRLCCPGKESGDESQGKQLCRLLEAPLTNQTEANNTDFAWRPTTHGPVNTTDKDVATKNTSEASEGRHASYRGADPGSAHQKSTSQKIYIVVLIILLFVVLAFVACWIISEACSSTSCMQAAEEGDALSSDSGQDTESQCSKSEDNEEVKQE